MASDKCFPRRDYDIGRVMEIIAKWCKSRLTRYLASDTNTFSRVTHETADGRVQCTPLSWLEIGRFARANGWNEGPYKIRVGDKVPLVDVPHRAMARMPGGVDDGSIALRTGDRGDWVRTSHWMNETPSYRFPWWHLIEGRPALWEIVAIDVEERTTRLLAEELRAIFERQQPTAAATTTTAAAPKVGDVVKWRDVPANTLVLKQSGVVVVCKAVQAGMVVFKDGAWGAFGTSTITADDAVTVLALGVAPDSIEECRRKALASAVALPAELAKASAKRGDEVAWHNVPYCSLVRNAAGQVFMRDHSAGRCVYDGATWDLFTVRLWGELRAQELVTIIQTDTDTILTTAQEYRRIVEAADQTRGSQRCADVKPGTLIKRRRANEFEEVVTVRTGDGKGWNIVGDTNATMGRTRPWDWGVTDDSTLIEILAENLTNEEVQQVMPMRSEEAIAWVKKRNAAATASKKDVPLSEVKPSSLIKRSSESFGTLITLRFADGSGWNIGAGHDRPVRDGWSWDNALVQSATCTVLAEDLTTAECEELVRHKGVDDFEAWADKRNAARERHATKPEPAPGEAGSRVPWDAVPQRSLSRDSDGQIYLRSATLGYLLYTPATGFQQRLIENWPALTKTLTGLAEIIATNINTGHAADSPYFSELVAAYRARKT